MKRIVLLTMAMVMTVAASAYRPIPIPINGVEIASSTRVLPEFWIDNFLDGAIWAAADSVSSVKIQEVRCQGDYSYGCFLVSYKHEMKRPSEFYVITYKVNEPGIIDAVLAYVQGDIAWADGAMLQSKLMYQLRGGEASCKMTDKGFDVERHYTAYMGSNGGPSFTEEGTLTTHYMIDEAGKITCADPYTTGHAKLTTEPNRSIPGREVRLDDITVEESDNTRALGPGVRLFVLIGTPLSHELTPSDFDGFCKWADELGRHLGPKAMNRIIDLARLWQSRAAGRRTAK